MIIQLPSTFNNIMMAQISAEEVANGVSLAAIELSKPCENTIIPSLADCFRQWKVIFGSLLSDLDLSDVDKENSIEGEKRIAALRKWRDRNGREATYKVLVDTLLNRGERYQAENLCKILAEHSMSGKNGQIPETTMTDCEAKESESNIRFRCPCGECSLETYLQDGCPKSCIPYLGMTTLSKADQEDLNYILEKDTMKIMDSFADLSNATCDSLIRQKVSVDKLVRVAISYNSSLHDKLIGSTSVDQVFAHLFPEMSFFNHESLGKIIHKLGDQNDKHLLTDYSTKFKEFCKRKVFEVEPGNCTCGQRLSQLKGRKLFAVVLPTGEEVLQSLGDAVRIKKTLVDILGVSPAALHLHRIDQGCVILVFSVPDSIAEKLFPLAKEKLALLRVQGMVIFVPQESTPQVEDIMKPLACSADMHESLSEHTPTVPSATPGELFISHSLPTSAQLSWTPVPEDKHNDTITGYIVQVEGPDSTQKIPVMDGSATSYEASDLRPYTTYTFGVSAMTEAGTGPPISISCTTPQGGKIQGLNLSEQENEKLQSEVHQTKREKEELVQRCHTLKSQRDAASDDCQETMNLLKDSEKRKQEISIRNTMSSNQKNFAGYCCRLVQVDSEAQPESSQPYGTIVKLSGLSLPIDGNQLYRQFPGLTLRVKDIQTEYILLTTHSLIPSSSDLSHWKFSDDFPSCKKTLDKYVVGVISCCGEESGFILSGPSTALKHRDKICKLGLNFTILFLSERFKQSYLAQFANQQNPPCLNINECKADIEQLGRYLQPTFTQVGEAASISSEAKLNVSAELSGTFEVVTGVSSNGNVSLSPIEVSIIDDVELAHNSQESSALRSSMKLARDIVTFQKVKTVQCKGLSQLSAGMPLVYVSKDGQESPKLIGMLTGERQVLILSSLFHLLKGTPAACLSLVVYTEMWRLWIYKWSHLLLPYLDSENHPAQPKLILEILIILLERKDKEEEHLLSVSRRDNPDTLLGFLKLLEVFFHHFSDQSKEVITQMTAEVCTQAGLRVDKFIRDIGGLCESLSLIAKYCCDQDIEDPKIASLVEHCFICANEMLKFQHDQGVVENVLYTEKFESTLTLLQPSCPSSIIMSNLVAFYRTLYASCKKLEADLKKQLTFEKESKHKLEEKIKDIGRLEEDKRKLEEEKEKLEREKEHLSVLVNNNCIATGYTKC